MTVLDASAILAYLNGEAGADLVEEHLEAGAVCPAVNWSEVAQKVLGAGRDWSLARSLLMSFGVDVIPVTAADAERAAAAWRPGSGLSLADRLCMAVGERSRLTVLTADSNWGDGDGIVQVR